MISLGETNESPSDQWSELEVEGGTFFQFYKAIQFCLGIGVFAQVMIEQRETATFSRCDVLYRVTVHEGKGCTQRFVASYDPIQSPAKSSPVEIAL